MMADGDICNNCIKLIQRLNRNKPFNKFIVNTYQANKGIRCHREHNYYKLIEKIKDDYNNGIGCTIPTNTKDTANKINSLLSKAGVGPDDILLYTADEEDIIMDINKEWGAKTIILHSPVCVCGLDELKWDPTPY